MTLHRQIWKLKVILWVNAAVMLFSVFTSAMELSEKKQLELAIEWLKNEGNGMKRSAGEISAEITSQRQVLHGRHEETLRILREYKRISRSLIRRMDGNSPILNP